MSDQAVARPSVKIRNRHADWVRAIWTSFRMTPMEYDRLFEAQRGVCAICARECASGKRLAVDHDHETGTVRGLLCLKCNTALGWFERNRSATLEYLRKSEHSSGAETADQVKVLRTPDVVRLTGIKRTSLIVMVQSGRFPRPLLEKRGRAKAWLARDVAPFLKPVAA